MKKIIFVTTTNDIIYNQYANIFFDEFEKFSQDIYMINYIDEGSNLVLEKSYNKIKSIFLNSTEHEQFKLYFGNFIEANGFQVLKEKLSENKFKIYIKDYTYKRNAIRYSYKVFAMYQAYKIALKKDYDFLIWSDADLRCKKNFGPDDLLEFLPENNQIMSYLGRTHFPNPKPHSETGFLGFNIKHVGFNDFITEIINTYVTGKIFSFDQWHDCWVFDRVREDFENKNFKFKNISGEYAHLKSPYNKTNLGIFFDHLKGNEAKKNLNSNDK